MTHQPARDAFRTPGAPVATYAIATATTLAFFGALIADWQGFVALAGGFIPARMAGYVDLPGAVPAWATPLSATLIHGGFLHLGFNLLMLVYCGRFVELALGWARTAALYGAGAYVSAAAQFVLDPASADTMIGASGAISALVGAYALLFAQRRPADWRGIPGSVLHIVWLGLAWTAIQLVFAYSMARDGTPIAIGAHIGGFIFGSVAAIPLLRWRARAVAGTPR